MKIGRTNEKKKKIGWTNKRRGRRLDGRMRRG